MFVVLVKPSLYPCLNEHILLSLSSSSHMPPIITPTYARWCSLTSSLSCVPSCVASSSASVQSSTSPPLRWCTCEPQPHRPLHGLRVLKKDYKKEEEGKLKCCVPILWCEEPCRIRSEPMLRLLALGSVCLEPPSMSGSHDLFTAQLPIKREQHCEPAELFLYTDCSTLQLSKIISFIPEQRGQYGNNN